MTAETVIDVRYPDVDAMGIVHHAVYPVWYEAARMDYFAGVGFSYSDMKALGINPPLVNLNINYKSTMSYPGTVTIKTECLAFGPRKLQLSYEATNEEGKLVGTATSFHIWTGPDNKTLDMAKNQPEVYERFRAAAGLERETL